MSSFLTTPTSVLFFLALVTRDSHAKRKPPLHVTFLHWLQDTRAARDAPHFVYTPSYGGLQPGAVYPAEAACLPEGPTWLRD